MVRGRGVRPPRVPPTVFPLASLPGGKTARQENFIRSSSRPPEIFRPRAAHVGAADFIQGEHPLIIPLLVPSPVSSLDTRMVTVFAPVASIIYENLVFRNEKSAYFLFF